MASKASYEVSNLSIPASWGWGIIFPMKKESLRSVRSVPCPMCGAAKGERCELTTGQPRTDPHRDRRVIAKDNEK